MGDRRAAQRLKGPMSSPVVAPGGPGSVISRDQNGSSEEMGKGGKDKDCIIM